MQSIPHIGQFDPHVDPVKPGGLSPADIADLVAHGWVEKTVDAEIPDAVVTFSDPSMPGGIALRRVSIAPGTPYLYNEQKGAVLMSGCGNGLGGIFGD